MRIEQRTVYIAEDGSEWESEEGAVRRGKFVALVNLCEKEGFEYWDDTDVAIFIQNKFKYLKELLDD